MNKILKPKIGQTRVPAFLYDVGVSYYDYGFISDKHSKVKLFDYYMVDKITQAQKIKILDKIPLAQFKTTGREYAPELTSLSIWIPKAGYYKTLAE